MENKEAYIYETKCRICGGLTEWQYSERIGDRWPGFIEIVSNHTQYPRQYECGECNKDTIQDVVSFTSSI